MSSTARFYHVWVHRPEHGWRWEWFSARSMEDVREQLDDSKLIYVEDASHPITHHRTAVDIGGQPGDPLSFSVQLPNMRLTFDAEHESHKHLTSVFAHQVRRMR